MKAGGRITAMNREEFERILQTGENVSIEIKRGGNGFEDDAYEHGV